MLTFDEPTHCYRWNGAVVPSVTQLLDKHHSFDGVPAAVMEEAKYRGTYVHALCEADDMDDLDPSEEGGEFWGYLLGWRAFMRDYRPNWSHIESRLYSKTFAYAGTLDRAGVLEKIGPGRVVLDIKSSADTHRTWGPQIAAYRQQLAEVDPLWITARRFSVRLRKDGTYRLDEWTNRLDWPFFQALLTQRNWELST